MPVFTFKATDLDLSLVQGTTIADTPRQARDELRQRGLSVHEIQAQRSPRSEHTLRLGILQKNRCSSAKLTDLVRELSTLLGVGMPMIEALDTVARQQRGFIRTSLLILRDRIAAGVSLADAMREQPGTFDSVTVHMAEVGENAGILDQVLNELALFKERMTQLQSKIGSALLYPAIVMFVGVGVSIFLMSYVVPNLLASLVESGRELPLITQIVKSISDLLVQRWWLLLGVLAALLVLFAGIYRTHTGRHTVHRILLKLPGVGELLRKQAVVRIAFITSTLMRSGIAFERAIAIARQSTANLVLQDALRACEQAVTAGRDIGAALEQTHAFSSTVVQVFALGQQSGRMEEMLERLAVDYDRQVATAATRLTAALEPVLILLLATVVGAIAFATILPILELGNVL